MAIDAGKQTIIEELTHAIQSGVKYDMESRPLESHNTDVKHLRTGVNLGMSYHGALVVLLIEKGLFTKDEYVDKMIEFLRREVASYEKMLTERFGKPTTLG